VTLVSQETQSSNDARMDRIPSEVWKILTKSTGQSAKEPVRLKNGTMTLNYEESATAFNDFFLTKVKKIKASIDNKGLDQPKNNKCKTSPQGY
jgi:hypothetical protein